MICVQITTSVQPATLPTTTRVAETEERSDTVQLAVSILGGIVAAGLVVTGAIVLAKMLNKHRTENKSVQPRSTRAAPPNSTQKPPVNFKPATYSANQYPSSDQLYFSQQESPSYFGKM